MLALLGFLSGLIFVCADLPYIRDTVIGKTKPHRTSWFLYFVLNTVSITNQLASGAKNSLWFPIAGAITTLIIFVLSLRRGVGGYEKLDVICLMGACIGISLWLLFNEPVLSILANLVATSLAVIPTLRKAYRTPQSETAVTYLFGAISALFAAVSVGKLNMTLLLLPIYSLIVQSAIYMLIIMRRLVV